VTDGGDLSRWNSPGPDGATSLDPDDADGLKLSWVATRGDLNAAEQDNILRSQRRARWRRPTTASLLDDVALRQLHKDMFGTVWKWAGTYRLRETTIGIAPERISMAVRDLVGNAAYWFDGDRPMELDDAACRFHHQLVQIHPFPNGNGRHARRITDLLVRAKGAPPFTWGIADLDAAGTTRKAYIAALQAADRRDYAPLRNFVRT
jgi:Fic-DOC domain mobile mystery protein B